MMTAAEIMTKEVVTIRSSATVAQAAHQQAKKPEKTALEEYLAEFPEVQEALIHKNWCSG
jgi:Mg/Co/Ni transporter MgtE